MYGKKFNNTIIYNLIGLNRLLFFFFFVFMIFVAGVGTVIFLLDLLSFRLIWLLTGFDLYKFIFNFESVLDSIESKYEVLLDKITL
jgi:hypothetical protein